MKVGQDNRVKLDRGEVRVGNFFVKRESGHVKIQDLNGVFSYRADVRMPVGIWLENMLQRSRKRDKGALNTLNVFASTMWSFFSVAPDDEFIKDVLSITDAALGRHPDWYGIKADATDEEDAEAAREVKEMMEFEEELKAKISEEDGGEGQD